MRVITPVAIVVCTGSCAAAYSVPPPRTSQSPFKTVSISKSPLFSTRHTPLYASLTSTVPSDEFSPSTAVTGSATTPESNVSIRTKSHADQMAQIRSEGGIFSFQTKYGALNPYAIYYGVTSILLGLVWFAEISACRFMYFLTRSKVDKNRRIPMFFSQVWGELLMLLTRASPKTEGKEILKEFFKTKQAAMFVANHNSWMDIPFLGGAIGWNNYKFVAKQELMKVPILSSAMKAGGHVIIDRTSRRSQFMTLKSGIQWLKDGVHLCTFPEGTRSRTGKLMEFKNGAFKMAYKAGAPVIPLSIIASGEVHPPHWMFPLRAARGVSKVIVHEPVYPEGKTEGEMAEAVRQAIISGLPEHQRP